MSGIATCFSRVSMIVAAAALAVVLLAPQPVYAFGPSDSATPPAPTGGRLQRAWAREQQIYTRLATLLDRAGDHVARAEQLIHRAKDNGKDATAVQAALDAFGAAVNQARPLYEGGKGIVASHQGFDDAGNVTDPVKALQTVREMRARLVEIRRIVAPSARALREAVRQFRQANRPVPAPTPEASSAQAARRSSKCRAWQPFHGAGSPSDQGRYCPGCPSVVYCP